MKGGNISKKRYMILLSSGILWFKGKNVGPNITFVAKAFVKIEILTVIHR
jgi:hypothetical protein